MKRLSRLVGTALLLSARRRLRAADLAEQFGVSERTVYRDLRALEDAGFPVEGTPGDGYHLAAGAYLRPLTFTPGEAEALVFAARFLAHSADAELRETLGRSVARLESALGPDARARLRVHRDRVRMPGDAREEGPMALLLDAVGEKKVVRIAYDGIARGAVTVRDIEPLGIVRLGGAWLVCAWCRSREDLRTFRSDRIQRAAFTGETYEDRPGFTFADVVRREGG